MPTFCKADNETRAQVLDVMRRFHGDLTEAEVTVDVLWCDHGERDDTEQPALKLHGYPCAATIKRTAVKDRLLGMVDAVLTIDRSSWNNLDDDERLALLDHELRHLELVVDKVCQVQADDAGRPKLRTRLHDWQLGGFHRIANRHGTKALEVQALAATLSDVKLRQQVFAWSDDCAPQEGTDLSASVADEIQAAVREMALTKDQ